MAAEETAVAGFADEGALVIDGVRAKSQMHAGIAAYTIDAVLFNADGHAIDIDGVVADLAP